MLAVWWVNFEYFCVPGEDGCVWVCGWRSIGCQAWSLVWHWSECKWFTFMETEQVTLRPRMCCDLMNKWRKLTALSVFSLKVPNWGLGCHCFCDPAPSWQFHAAHCKLCFCSSCGLHMKLPRCPKVWNLCRTNWLLLRDSSRFWSWELCPRM